MFLLAEIDSNLTFVLVFLCIAAVFFMVEVCTPTFGIMAFAAIASEVAAIVFAFRESSAFGFTMLAVCLIGTPIYLYFMVKFLPKTPIGKVLILRKGRVASSDATPEADKLESLKGKRGVTISLLRPVGKVRIEGSVYDARAERATIESGIDIEVIDCCGTDVVVREMGSL